MKNYGLQVKEIPIIFRNNIEPAILKDEEYAGSILGFNKTGNEFVQTLPINSYGYPNEIIYPYNTINIRINNEMYTNLTPTLDGNMKKYGAPGNIGNHDFSVFPFALAVWGSGTNLYVPNNNPVNIEFWGTDPYISGKKILACDLTGNGQINHFRARFACGENGTLHLKPYVILNGNIRVDLCNFAAGGDQYIAGDNEEIEFDCYVPIETHAVAYVEAENTGEYPSLVDAAMTVQYEDFIESESIVGYEGVNLRRGRR